MRPRMSIVILTLNEESSISRCIGALSRQTESDFETIVVDAASTDATLERAHQAGASLRGPLRIHACEDRLPIGAARNLGARLAQAPLVAFVSADADLHHAWVERALRAFGHADMVFGRQVHAPLHHTTASTVRGLRYGFPTTRQSDVTRFASNVAGAYRKEILLRFPFDDDADAAEDLLIAKQAERAGYKGHYDPGMVVFHHDVTTPREELRKNIREGRGWAAYRDHLGLARPWLVWGTGLVATAALAAVRGRGFAAVAGVLWAPAVRRAMRRPSHLDAIDVAKAVLVSPLYDAVFLANYVAGLARPAKRRDAESAPELTA